jgi:hypothetical protein
MTYSLDEVLLLHLVAVLGGVDLRGYRAVRREEASSRSAMERLRTITSAIFLRCSTRACFVSFGADRRTSRCDRHRRQGELIKAHVFTAEHIYGDDTAVPVLAKIKTRTGWLWTYVRDSQPFGGTDPPAAVFSIPPIGRVCTPSGISPGIVASCRPDSIPTSARSTTQPTERKSLDFLLPSGTRGFTAQQEAGCCYGREGE